MVAALDEDDVVIAQGVRHHDEILAVDLLDEWLVAADIVEGMEIAELLQQRQRIGAAPEPVAVVAERTRAGGRFDHVAGRDQKRPLFLTTHRVLRAPARAMAGRLVTARDDFLGKRGMALNGLADHVRGDLDPVAIPEVQHGLRHRALLATASAGRPRPSHHRGPSPAARWPPCAATGCRSRPAGW